MRVKVSSFPKHRGLDLCGPNFPIFYIHGPKWVQFYIFYRRAIMGLVGSSTQ
ncbi:hypothetical protein Csa_013603, partial [Cucumis sativus]